MSSGRLFLPQFMSDLLHFQSRSVCLRNATLLFLYAFQLFPQGEIPYFERIGFPSLFTLKDF